PAKVPMGYEALLRVKGSESSLTEARFIIPLADRYGLTYALDRCVIDQVLKKVKEDTSTTPYIINLSASTLNHEESMEYLLKTLSSGNYRNRLIFELDEHTILNNLDQVKKIAKQFKEHGVELAVEHYGHDFSSFDRIKGLHLLYLKIDGSYIRDLANQDTQFYINFLTKVAHTVGMKVVAECLETDEQFHHLQTFQVDAAQGRYLAPPENAEAVIPAKVSV
ncbi:MAG: EAL domain-containing protein, partial [Legionella sp.]